MSRLNYLVGDPISFVGFPWHATANPCSWACLHHALSLICQEITHAHTRHAHIHVHHVCTHVCVYTCKYVLDVHIYTCLIDIYILTNIYI